VSSATVRYWRGAWIVDVSTPVDGKRKRMIESFGAGAKGKAAAEAEARRDELAPLSKTDRFWKQRHATFRDLWNRFAAQLVGPVPGPATIVDYKAMARLYLLPLMGDGPLSQIDAESLIGLKTRLLREAGVKAAVRGGSGKPLAPRTVAKILTLIGTVFRFGKVVKIVTDNPVADVKKPKAAKKAVYILEPDEIARLRAALSVPWERLLVELTITTGLRSGEVRGLTWEALDLNGKRLFVEQQATRRREDDRTKTESSVRTVPSYLIPELKRWKLALSADRSRTPLSWRAECARRARADRRGQVVA
jgi:integrase